MTDSCFFIENIPTPTGTMLLVTDARGHLCALDWDDHAARMHRLWQLQRGGRQPRLEPRRGTSDANHAVRAYFGGVLSAIDAIDVATGGTAFQRQVWAALRHIPAGRTTTYGVLAVQLGRARAMRAVGMANGANPIALAVPCHRVIGANGALTGYGGGIERKRWLLKHEGALPDAPLLPPKQTHLFRTV